MCQNVQCSLINIQRLSVDYHRSSRPKCQLPTIQFLLTTKLVQNGLIFNQM